MDQVLTLSVQAAFIALFAVALVRWLRRRTKLNRDVLAVFASIAGLFAAQLLTLVWPDRRDIVVSAAAILLLAEPYLVLRLIQNFQHVDRRVERGVLLAFFASSGLLLANAVVANRILVLLIVAYFVAASALGSRYLLRAAAARAGASRTRLRTAAIASGLLGLSVLVAGTASGNQASDSALVFFVSRMSALLAAIAFLAAFAPPAALRRSQQRAVAFDLARGLVSAPTGTPADDSWSQLAAAARRITGANAVAVAVGRPRPVLRATDGEWAHPPPIGEPLPGVDLPDDATARSFAALTAPPALAELATSVGASTVIQVPIGSDRNPVGCLFAFMAGSPLFVEDDLALLALLAALTARSIERDEAIAERTTLVTELRRTNDELARASAAKSDFLAAMSHELRTPLNSIIGFSELMLAPVNRPDGFRPLDVADWASHIHGAGLQLLDLINEVLDLARIEAGRLELRHERFDIATLLGRITDSMRPVADRRQVRVLTSLPASPVAIEADPARVRQIVYNLLSNAIKFSPEGGEVRLRAAVDGSSVRVTVEDDGPGITREDQLRLFEAFQQTATGRAQAEGTGLGLALARQLAERHGGRIELVSDPGAGSRFTLVLPLERPADAALTASHDPAPPLVLIVEDDPASAALLRAYLEPDGYRVAVAPDGERGLDALRRLRPAAVILDIVLPGIDGWEVMQRARSEPATRDIPILVVSLIDGAELGVALGAVDFFAKPVDRSLLLARLRRVLEVAGHAPPEATVLAIDDEEPVLEMYRAMLDSTGYRVITASSGQAGVALARREPPDVVLLDVTMPDLDGFQVAAQLHADPTTARIPIVVMTGRDLDAEEKQRLNRHVNQILRKGDEAAAGLRRWLAIHASPGAEGASGGRRPAVPADGSAGPTDVSVVTP